MRIGTREKAKKQASGSSALLSFHRVSRFFFSQLKLQLVKLPLQLGSLLGVEFAADGGWPLLEGPFPFLLRLLLLPQAHIDMTQVFEYGRIVGNQTRRPFERRLGQVETPHLVISPA